VPHPTPREFGLHEVFKLNVECNHATLAGHSCAHETETAVAMGREGVGTFHHVCCSKIKTPFDDSKYVRVTKSDTRK
jgi:hypothetical protein